MAFSRIGPDVNRQLRAIFLKTSAPTVASPQNKLHEAVHDPSAAGTADGARPGHLDTAIISDAAAHDGVVPA
ncbi:MAG TPA: hypothetical protein VGF99_10670, partial [Myxococcota bacterium]